jgi:hypothetical protein
MLNVFFLFASSPLFLTSLCSKHVRCNMFTVLDPGKGVCADPVGRAAILEVKGPGPPVGVSERQLSPDRGGEKT